MGRRRERRSRSWQESGPRRPTRTQTSRRNHRPPIGCGWERIVLLSPRRSEQMSPKSPSLLARGGRCFPRRQKLPSRRQLPSSRLPILRLWRNTKRQLAMLVATTTRRVPRSSEDALAESEASSRQSVCSHCFLSHDHSQGLVEHGSLAHLSLGAQEVAAPMSCQVASDFLQPRNSLPLLSSHVGRWATKVGEAIVPVGIAS